MSAKNSVFKLRGLKRLSIIARKPGYTTEFESPASAPQPASTLLPPASIIAESSPSMPRRGFEHYAVHTSSRLRTSAAVDGGTFLPQRIHTLMIVSNPASENTSVLEPTIVRPYTPKYYSVPRAHPPLTAAESSGIPGFITFYPKRERLLHMASDKDVYRPPETKAGERPTFSHADSLHHLAVLSTCIDFGDEMQADGMDPIHPNTGIFSRSLAAEVVAEDGGEDKGVQDLDGDTDVEDDGDGESEDEEDSREDEEEQEKILGDGVEESQEMEQVLMERKRESKLWDGKGVVGGGFMAS